MLVQAALIGWKLTGKNLKFPSRIIPQPAENLQEHSGGPQSHITADVNSPCLCHLHTV